MKEKPNFIQIVESLLSHVPERSRKIIRKRFGLEKGERETLEAIGGHFRITRERVRQIVSDVLKTVSKKIEEPEFHHGEEHLILEIENKSGIIKENDLDKILNLVPGREVNAVKFLAECSRKIIIFEEKSHISRSWVLTSDSVAIAKRVADQAQEVLDQGRALMKEAELVDRIFSRLPEFEKQSILSYLNSLVKVQKNAFGKWGMHHWLEVNPKGTREKIYLVMKEENRPLHFREIAALIDRAKLGKKKAHPQTVHNELIKDSRFVLIGRGIYALREWGYNEGTIKDVIKDILSGSKRPLGREEILRRVFAARRVKKTTVMINLNNSKLFVRENNYYSLKR